MPNSRLWTHEAHRCGAAALALPVLACVAIIAAAVAANAAHAADPRTVGLGMVRLMSWLMPVTAGIATAAALGRERLPELQLSVPTAYRRTVARRIALIVGVVTVASAVAIAGLAAFGQWNHPAHGPLALLVPLGPSLLLVGVGAWADVVLRSTGGASAVVVGAWLFQLIMFDRVVGIWQVNRTLLMLAGLALIGLALRGLRDTERLIVGGTE